MKRTRTLHDKESIKRFSEKMDPRPSPWPMSGKTVPSPDTITWERVRLSSDQKLPKIPPQGEDDEQTYNPKLWSQDVDFAYDKIEQSVNGLKEDKMLYPELISTLQEKYRPGESILDVGCCGGHFYETLKHYLGDITYTGLDVTPEYIEAAKKRHPEVQWTVGDARKMDFPDKSFDHVLCLFVLCHLDEQGVGECVDELTRIARKEVLIAAYISCTRFNTMHRGKAGKFIYDIIDVDELRRDGWDLFICADTWTFDFPMEADGESVKVVFPVTGFAMLERIG